MSDATSTGAAAPEPAAGAPAPAPRFVPGGPPPPKPGGRTDDPKAFGSEPYAVDVSVVHRALDAAEAEFRRLFGGADVPNEEERFAAGLARIRDVVDQAADMAPKAAWAAYRAAIKTELGEE